MALAYTTHFEVRTDGDSTNGGGFNAKRLTAGTDYSQQTSAQYSTSSGQIQAGALDWIYVPGASFGADCIANVIYLESGTDCTPGFYEIIADYSADRQWIQLDRECATTDGATNVTFKYGGAQSDLQRVADGVDAGNIVWIKAGTYTLSAAWSLPLGVGTAQRRISYIGYNSVRGDATSPCVTLDRDGGTDYGILLGSVASWGFYNFAFIDVTNVAGSVSYGILSYARNLLFYRCRLHDVGGHGWYMGNGYGAVLIECEAKNWGQDTTSNRYGIYLSGQGTAKNCFSHITSGSVTGKYGTYASWGTNFIDCISAGCYIGHYVANTSDYYTNHLHRPVAYNCVSGIYTNGSGGASYIYDPVITACILFGIYNYSTSPYNTVAIFRPVFYGNNVNYTKYSNVGLIGLPILSEYLDVLDSVEAASDPFVDAINNDFRLRANVVGTNGEQILGNAFIGNNYLIDGEIVSLGNADPGAVQAPRVLRRT